MTAERKANRKRGFLFADLVGFTEFTEQRGDEAGAEIAIAFCDHVCELNRGHGAEDVKMIGDACMIHIPEPAPAVELALGIVERIGPERGFPRVRVGLDWGRATRRRDDWFGTTVNTAARLAAAADEGSVLTTVRMRRAAQGLTGIGFASRGLGRLRGLREPLELYAATRATGPGQVRPAVARS